MIHNKKSIQVDGNGFITPIFGVIAQIMSLIIMCWNYLPWIFAFIFWFLGMKQESIISIAIGVFIAGVPGDVMINGATLKIKAPACIFLLIIAFFDPFNWINLA